MTPPPEKRFDVGEAEEIFDNDVDGLPQMPPQDDIGWLRKPRSPARENKGTSKAKAPRSGPAGHRRPKKK